MTRVAAVDCGTNSIRLLVADVDPDAGTLRDLHREMRVVRLGEGVDRTGRLAPEALRRTLDATGDYARLVHDLGAERVRFVATSASRDAENREEFVAGVRERLGVEPEVVTGVEEAALSFAGATREAAGAGLAGPYLVADIGGGSTEVVRGEDDVQRSRSVDVGCVRLTERHLAGDPPTREQPAAARADVEAALDAVEEQVPMTGVGTLVGLAGSVLTVACTALRLPAYDATRTHLSRLPVDQVLAACDQAIAMPRAERAALPFMHPGRVDVIGAGALIWRSLVERVADRSGTTEVVASEHDILDGIAFGLAAGAGAMPRS
ncbi:hydrolase [Angustibacter aerolatus]|uniref:Hydrolase n=1 Tax=Angustibacter aerolatus TaxID=1162965 RepID=A0ABQ6JED8_9ACTN|nr:hydrolase [Angustibacter aerolatus]